jgi:hypothetical protein
MTATAPEARASEQQAAPQVATPSHSCGPFSMRMIDCDFCLKLTRHTTIQFKLPLEYFKVENLNLLEETNYKSNLDSSSTIIHVTKAVVDGIHVNSLLERIRE